MTQITRPEGLDQPEEVIDANDLRFYAATFVLWLSLNLLALLIIWII